MKVARPRCFSVALASARVVILRDALRKGMADPAFTATLARLNEDPLYLGTDAYREFVIERIVEWKKAIEEVGARSE